MVGFPDARQWYEAARKALEPPPEDLAACADRLDTLTPLVFKYQIGRLIHELVGRFGQAVRHGPFAGMVCGIGEHWINAPAQLIGSYEAELHPALERIIASQPRVVVNIGAGDGYYSVGMARRLPDAHVWAIDRSATCRGSIQDVARANNVADRISVRDAVGPDELNRLVGPEVCLLMDCEGCERELLDLERVPALRTTTVLVELHEMVVAGLTERIREQFQPSHELELIRVQPRDPSSYPETASMSPIYRWLALFEGRSFQHWAYLTPRSAS